MSSKRHGRGDFYRVITAAVAGSGFAARVQLFVVEVTGKVESCHFTAIVFAGSLTGGFVEKRCPCHALSRVTSARYIIGNVVVRGVRAGTVATRRMSLWAFRVDYHNNSGNEDEKERQDLHGGLFASCYTRNSGMWCPFFCEKFRWEEW